MPSLAQWTSRFLSITTEDWQYLTSEVPELHNMERFLRDHDTKRRIITELSNTPLHNREQLFKDLARVVREENYTLQMQRHTLYKACRTAHATAESGKYHKLHIIMTGMDCDAFWNDWTKNMETQEEFFDRAGDNIWLESARMDIIHDLIDQEHQLLRPFGDVRKALREHKQLPSTAKTDTPAQPAPQASAGPPVATVESQVTKPSKAEQELDERWRRFRDVNAKNTCRCPGSLCIECTPEEAVMIRQFAQELREKKLPEENIKGRFIEFLAKIEAT